MHRRKFVKTIAAASSISMVPYFGVSMNKKKTLDLSLVRKSVFDHCTDILDKEGPYGCYREGIGKRPDLYSSCDVAIMRTVMGEDLSTMLTDDQRKQWIGHINSFANNFHGQPTDGSYGDIHGHSIHHANGMVIGALGVLGGKQKYPVKLYDTFDDPKEVAPWLESIDWSHQWSASHLFWGGMVCFAMSVRCNEAWKNTVFDWLDNNIDPQTGWWKKGVSYADRNQPLGGSVHILPFYQLLNKTFPLPEKIIDSVLDLQLPNGRWLQDNSVHVMNYLDMDALYALRYMSSLAPGYRTNKIKHALERYSDLVISYWQKYSEELLTLHPHSILAAVSTFGLLHQFCPDRFIDDDVHWTDIFSDTRLYQTKEVESF